MRLIRILGVGFALFVATAAGAQSESAADQKARRLGGFIGAQCAEFWPMKTEAAVKHHLSIFIDDATYLPASYLQDYRDSLNEFANAKLERDRLKDEMSSVMNEILVHDDSGFDFNKDLFNPAAYDRLSSTTSQGAKLVALQAQYNIAIDKMNQAGAKAYLLFQEYVNYQQAVKAITLCAEDQIAYLTKPPQTASAPTAPRPASRRADVGLTGKWDGGAAWGEVTILDGPDNYNGTWNVPSNAGTGKLAFAKSPGGGYTGSWSYPYDGSSGKLTAMTVSPDGQKISISWTSPDGPRGSVWVRKP